MLTMPTVKYAEKAESDLYEIVDYSLYRWGKIQTHTYIYGLEKLAQSLAANPKIGKICHDLQEGLLAFPYQSHVLYYLQEPHGITIVRILHQNMNSSLHFGVAGGTS